MSTRSRINYKMEDGRYKSVYCHFDGYPSHNGNILYHHYKTLDAVKALVDQGDMSSLGESSDCPPGHSYDSRVKGYTVYYGRDRGEEGTDPIVTDEPETESYGYVFEDGQWFVNATEDGEYIPLVDLYDEESGVICDESYDDEEDDE